MDDLKSKAELLEGLADKNNIDWRSDAGALPPDDDVARIGLLAERLGLPLSAALDPALGEREYMELMEKDQPDHG